MGLGPDTLVSSVLCFFRIVSSRALPVRFLPTSNGCLVHPLARVTGQKPPGLKPPDNKPLRLLKRLLGNMPMTLTCSD